MKRTRGDSSRDASLEKENSQINEIQEEEVAIITSSSSSGRLPISAPEVLEGETSDHLDSIFIISCLKREGSGVQASGPPCPPLPRRPPRQGGPGCVGDKALYLVTRSLITADLRYATMRLNAIPGEIEEERAIDAANFLKVGEKCSAVQGTR